MQNRPYLDPTRRDRQPNSANSALKHHDHDRSLSQRSIINNRSKKPKRVDACPKLSGKTLLGQSQARRRALRLAAETALVGILPTHHQCKVVAGLVRAMLPVGCPVVRTGFTLVRSLIVALLTTPLP